MVNLNLVNQKLKKLMLKLKMIKKICKNKIKKKNLKRNEVCLDSLGNETQNKRFTHFIGINPKGIC